MPSNTVTIIAGVLAVGFFMIVGVGLFFALKKFFRWIHKILFFSNIRKNPESLELIETFIDGTPTKFKCEMLLLNEFSDKEVEGLVYAFKKIKKLKGGKSSNVKPKSK